MASSSCLPIAQSKILGKILYPSLILIPLSGPSASPTTSTFKIYSESSHFLPPHCYLPDLIHHHPSPGLFCSFQIDEASSTFVLLSSPQSIINTIARVILLKVRSCHSYVQMIPMLFPLILNKNLNPDTIYKALCDLIPANPVFLSPHLLLFSPPFLFSSHADISENTTFLPQRYFLCQKFSLPYTCLALVPSGLYSRIHFLSELFLGNIYIFSSQILYL